MQIPTQCVKSTAEGPRVEGVRRYFGFSRAWVS